MAKKIEIPKLSDDRDVAAAQKLLADVQAKFEKAANYPLVDDLAERARALLDGTKQPQREPDQVQVLREVVRLATARLNTAKEKAAERIITEITPDYQKLREELLTECLRFKEVLDIHDSFIQRLWVAGLGNFLAASWSLKVPVVGFFPHGKLDSLVENLKIAT